MIIDFYFGWAIILNENCFIFIFYSSISILLRLFEKVK